MAQNTFGSQTRGATVFGAPAPAKKPGTGYGDYSNGQPKVNPSSGLGAAVNPRPVNPRSGAVTNINRINPRSGAGTNVTRRPTVNMYQLGQIVGNQRPAASVPAYNNNYYSQVDAWARSKEALGLMSNQIDLSTTLAGNAATRAEYEGRVAQINADAAAADARLKENLAYSGDVKAYLAGKYMIDTQAQNLRAEALQNTSNANLRQTPLLEGKEQDVEGAYANDLARLNTQETATQTGYASNLRDQSRAQGAAGVGASSGTNADIKKIGDDYQAAMAQIGQDRTNVTIKHGGDIRDLEEAKAVVGDNQRQYAIDMRDIGNAKTGITNDYNHAIADIDHQNRLGRIDANQAAAQAAAARKTADAQMAALAQADQAARDRASVQNAQAAQQADQDRRNAAASGAFGSPPPGATQVFGGGQRGTGSSAYSPTPATSPGGTERGAAPGTPRGTFSPDLTYLGNPNNPLGISDDAYGYIANMAKWNAKGDPVGTMTWLSNYVKFFGPQILQNQRNAGNSGYYAYH
jgi:hypothetical protein